MSDTDMPIEADPLEGLEERLKSHNQAFESLLALTPAREYYGSHFVDGRDPSDQWNRKKQTKEEKRAARKAKLHPDNQKSALDVMKEREAEAKAKRKRNEEVDGEEVEKGNAAGSIDRAAKRQKNENDSDAEARRAEKVQKKKDKRQRRKDKAENDKAKAEAKRERKQQRKAVGTASEEKPSVDADDGPREDTDVEVEDEDEAVEGPDGLEKFDVTGLAELHEAASAHSSAPTTPVLDSPAFDLATNGSAASSSSSLDQPPASDPTVKPSNPKSQSKPKPSIDTAVATLSSTAPAKSTDLPSGTSSPKLQLPQINDEELQSRLRARIEALRAARKADGPDGKPAKSRQELLEQRRKKEEQRKANKKAQRQKANEDEQRRREEQLRGSGSPLSRVGDIFSPQPRENNFSFSRLAFQDGSSANADLTELHDPKKKKKGPQDARTALQAAQNRDAKVAGYDSEKQANIAEKDMWFNARKRAGGERVRDDTSLLKKALKRKEKAKSKSESDWKEREEAVVKGKEMKQKKREANLQKRREEKGGKGKKKAGKKGPKKRPGFEGRFKA